MQAFANQQPPDIQALFSQFMAQLPAETLAQLHPADGRINLRTEPRTHLPTNEAALSINRKPQTLRGWHSAGCYAIPELRPIRVNGRLAWPVSGLRKLMLGVAA